MWVCTSLDILIFQKLEAGKSRYRQIAAQHKEARQECRQVIRCRINGRHIRRDFDKPKADLDFQESQNHFQDIGEIWNFKTEHNTRNGISGIDCHSNRKTDMRHCMQNARQHAQNISA